MSDEPDSSLLASDLPEIVCKIRARTPARILMGRAGAAYRTSTQMDLREAHAAARDAVREELDLEKAFGAPFKQQWQLFETRTQASRKDEYLLRPDLGRHFDRASREEIRKLCSPQSDLQIAIGDGLSVPAIATQVPHLLPLLHEGAKSRGWKIGRTFVVRYCRVGILNEIGELLNPRVVVLLIGERPGLATAESLSTYMAYRPLRTHSDADRNLISNIHARGLDPHNAAARILRFVAQLMLAKISGCTLREELPTIERE